MVRRIRLLPPLFVLCERLVELARHSLASTFQLLWRLYCPTRAPKLPWIHFYKRPLIAPRESRVLCRFIQGICHISHWLPVQHTLTALQLRLCKHQRIFVCPTAMAAFFSGMGAALRKAVGGEKPVSKMIETSAGQVEVSADEVKLYGLIFDSIDSDANGEIGGGEGATFLRRSGLSDDNLKIVSFAQLRLCPSLTWLASSISADAATGR